MEKEDIIRKICDKDTLDALGLVKSINPKKEELLRAKILNYFENRRVPISYEIYQELVKNVDKEHNISFQRKIDTFGLDEIDDDL